MSSAVPVPGETSLLPSPAFDDTIVAISTPPGVGALHVIRISGPDAFSIAQRILRTRKSFESLAPRSVSVGTALDRNAAPVDQVLVTILPSPGSYTGEDVVEISGHGSTIASGLILEAAVHAGARPALPGEFTRRAFQNGRIDLVQAEAVADLIHARGERALRNALAQLDGGLSRRLAAVRERILDALAPLEAFIDFGDDVPEPPGSGTMRRAISDARSSLEEFLAGSRRASLLAEGATVALVGKPNVGKSSLLNAFAGSDRAIVHPTPGTTRDTVEVNLSLQGLPVTLIDTAGMRRTPDPVEGAGVERSRRALRSAQLVVLVVDASRAPDDDDRDVAGQLDGSEVLVVRNKADLGDDAASAAWCRTLTERHLVVSALRGDGVRELIEETGLRLSNQLGSDEGVTMTRARQYDLVRRAVAALDRAEAALAGGSWADMVAAELRDSLQAVAELTGEAVGPDILDRIFHSFCIGK